MTAYKRAGSSETSPRWPTGSMLFIGTFGARHSAAGRRYHSRVWIALGVCVCFQVLRAATGTPAAAWPLALVVAVTFAYIAAEMWRYIGSLDELARRLQLEAMSITYLIGLAVWLGLAGYSQALHFDVHPGLFILLEPVRGVVLLVRARAYQ